MPADDAARPSPGHVVVVGGGIAGLAAAYRLTRDAPPGTRVSLLEGSPRLGGKLRTGEVGGVPAEEGAEALLARVPEAVALAAEVGLGDDLVHPATTSAGLWTRGALRPIPPRTVMGVPGDLGALERSGVLSAAGLLRLPLDLLLPQTPLDGDVAVGRYVAARLGREVVDRLVDPLLGGVYAGRADGLSLAATVPALAAEARRRRSLLLAARRATAPKPAAGAGSPAGRPAPVFAGVRGGLGRLAAAVADAARAGGADIRTAATVRRLARTPAGWRLAVGPTRDETAVDADAVVLAVPAHPAGRLLAEAVPAAAADLAGIGYASMALVTLALDRTGLPPLPGSGFLVPAVEGRLVKGVTFLSAKWPWVAAAAGDRLAVVRCSVGRYGEPADVQRDDADLARGCLDDLAGAVGATGAVVAARVSRWGGGLPQYEVGHVERVRRIRAAVAERPGLAVCGAAYDGLGVPACLRSAYAAVEQVLAHLDSRARMG